MRTYGVRYFTRFGNISRSGIGVAELKFTANGTAWAQRKCGMRDMRWCVMQSMKHKKWILAVMNNDSTAYEVTDVMSDNVKKIIQYADYLNLVNSGKGIEAGMLERLEQLRLCYEMKESQVQMT